MVPKTVEMMKAALLPKLTRPLLLLCLALPLAACGSGSGLKEDTAAVTQGASPQVLRLIDKYSAEYEVPKSLVHRVVRRESSYNPRAQSRSYYGLMQIHPQTARTMGHKGSAGELLDAETNLRYGVKYLRGAWLVANGSEDRAISWYSKGYYYEAKRRGMLKQVGLAR